MVDILSIYQILIGLRKKNEKEKERQEIRMHIPSFRGSSLGFGSRPQIYTKDKNKQNGCSQARVLVFS